MGKAGLSVRTLAIKDNQRRLKMIASTAFAFPGGTQKRKESGLAVKQIEHDLNSKICPQSSGTSTLRAHNHFIGYFTRDSAPEPKRPRVRIPLRAHG